MSRKKILIIDDEPEIVKVISLRLKANGYEVITGASGEEALSLTKEHMPDLVILDVMMPAPNGYKVCRLIKDDAETEHIPVILLTAKTSESDKFWGNEAGADEYLMKPYNAEELLASIKRLTEE
ncbi:MAG: response regulator [Candidatus Omnitrophica bacterium]|nr:response regulator [Candidatus Omnitrophota bacterium]MBU1996020.1 response regulator [Candidatus Omnitrophota bacterium]